MSANSLNDSKPDCSARGDSHRCVIGSTAPLTSAESEVVAVCHAVQSHRHVTGFWNVSRGVRDCRSVAAEDFIACQAVVTAGLHHHPSPSSRFRSASKESYSHEHPGPAV